MTPAEFLGVGTAIMCGLCGVAFLAVGLRAALTRKPDDRAGEVKPERAIVSRRRAG